MHNCLMSNVGLFFFFFLDLSQFLHVGFVLVNYKHCPVFFFFRRFALRFREITYAKKLSFPSGIFWRSFVE